MRVSVRREDEGLVTEGQRVEAAAPASEGGEIRGNGDRMVALGVEMRAKGGASAGECALVLSQRRVPTTPKPPYFTKQQIMSQPTR
ncbi:hypothetical protein U1Q18_014390 [Sarracenia purpurea var. burkii]